MRWDLDWIEKRSQLTPDRIAVVDGDTNHRWTYKELNQRAHTLAKYLEEQGVQKGSRVAIICPNHISYFDFLFACMKMGSIFVPINWRLSSVEVQTILEDCTPTFLGFHSKHKHILPEWEKILQLDHQEYEDIFRRSLRYQPDVLS